MLNNWFALLCAAIYSLDNYMTSEKKRFLFQVVVGRLLAELYLGSSGVKFHLPARICE